MWKVQCVTVRAMCTHFEITGEINEAVRWEVLGCIKAKQPDEIGIEISKSTHKKHCDLGRSVKGFGMGMVTAILPKLGKLVTGSA